MDDYKKLSALNILTDIFGKLSVLAIGIVLPKLFIEQFGSEINGFISSINNILVYVNLLEAGIGSASTQALYYELAKNNINGINGIISATSKFYRRTGMYFAIIVFLLAVLYPLCIETSISFRVVFELIILSSIPSLIKYYFQGKYTVLLQADNRAYALNVIYLITNSISNILRISMIVLKFDIIFVQMSYSIASLINLLIIYAYIRKKYPYINDHFEPDEGPISKSKYAFVHTISSTIFSNIDVLILSIFCGLKTVSVYSIYHTIFLHINQIIKAISNGTSASFGKLYTINRESFSYAFLRFKIAYRYLAWVILLVASCLILPFIMIYSKNFTDIKYVDKWLPILFFLSNYLDVIRWPEVIAVNCTGFFKETARQAIIETILNLVFSAFLVRYFGLYGVIFATIIALSYRTIDFFIFVYKNITHDHTILSDILFLIFSVVISALLINFTNLNIPKSVDWTNLFKYSFFSIPICSIICLFSTFLFYKGEMFDILRIFMKKII